MFWYHHTYKRAYDCLNEHGFIHKKVNHSDPDNPFVAEDGTHNVLNFSGVSSNVFFIRTISIIPNALGT